ncbi:uncharacterized protein LOC107269263 isoform X2 [Cephus cinctus]|uniref:Uncharacterized protein LOC107269263 isoform X2 n=1 Tax=Cephus cinctus TaxID=211228 RepID=A0AAJ7FLZ5_CEPCN|nr:uncharacterized protein LOC107269263 isoform X2 [Cephus cinctus]
MTRVEGAYNKRAYDQIELCCIVTVYVSTISSYSTNRDWPPINMPEPVSNAKASPVVRTRLNFQFQRQPRRISTKARSCINPKISISAGMLKPGISSGPPPGKRDVLVEATPKAATAWRQYQEYQHRHHHRHQPSRHSGPTSEPRTRLFSCCRCLFVRHGC